MPLRLQPCRTVTGMAAPSDIETTAHLLAMAQFIPARICAWVSDQVGQHFASKNLGLRSDSVLGLPHRAFGHKRCPWCGCRDREGPERAVRRKRA